MYGMDTIEGLDPGIEVDADFKILSFTGFFKYMLAPEYTTAYLKGALGFYNGKVSGSASAQGETMDFDESSTDLGIGFGGGYQKRGDGNMGFFVEGMFHNVFTEDSSTNYINFRGGVIFFMGE